MLRLLLLLLFIYLWNNSELNASTLPDSIEIKLKELKNDSLRTRYLNDLAFKNRFVNPSFSEDLINTSLKILSKYEDCYASSDANGILGNLADKHGNFRSALLHYFKALQLAENCKIANLKASNHNNIGLVYQRLQIYDSALIHLNQSLELKKKIGNRKSYASTYNNIGLVYYQQLKYKEALNYFLESLKLKEEFNDRNSMSSTLLNISNIYRELGLSDSAKKMVLKSIEIRKEFNDNWGLASSYNNLGLLLKDEKKFKQALQVLNESAKYSLLVKDYETLVKTYNNIGEIYLAYKEFDKAIDILNNSIYEAKNKSFTRSEQLGLNILSKVYLEKKQFDKAIECLNKSLAIADSLGDIIGRKKTLETLIEVNSKANKNPDALQVLNEYKLLNDSVVYGKLASELAAIQHSYEVLKAKKTTEQLSLENKLKDVEIENIRLRERQNIIATAILLGLFLISILSLLFYIRFKKRENNRILIETQNIAKNEERERISRDIHDELGTNLSRIALSAESALSLPPYEKQHVLSNISKLSREVISNITDLIWYLNPQNNSLNDLLIRIRENITEYLLENNIDYEIELDLLTNVDLRIEFQRHLMLIIRETVHNAVKHSSCSKITIKSELHDNTFGILIKDNGKGFDDSLISNGNGLKNIKQRVQYLNAFYKFTSSSEGTSFFLVFPISENKIFSSNHPYMLLTNDKDSTTLA